jgi:hypothetical protein
MHLNIKGFNLMQAESYFRIFLFSQRAKTMWFILKYTKNPEIRKITRDPRFFKIQKTGFMTIVFLIILYSFCLDANKRNSDLDVNKGFSGARGRLFKILKTLIFSSTNPLENCIIYFCRKVSYSSFFLS